MRWDATFIVHQVHEIEHATGEPPSLPPYDHTVEQIARRWFDQADAQLREPVLSERAVRALQQCCEQFADKFAETMESTEFTEDVEFTKDVELTQEEDGCLDAEREALEALGDDLFSEVLDWLVGSHKSVYAAKRLLCFAENLSMMWEAIPENMRDEGHPASEWGSICEHIEQQIGTQLLKYADETETT